MVEYSASTLDIAVQDNYAIVTLKNGKVNAINTPLLQDLQNTFESLENDDLVRGVILAGDPHKFSAGLDVLSLATQTYEESIEFWECYMHALQAMVKLSKPFVCAITGYAPAGATILTICADYRIMGRGEKHVVGMHEFKMNMGIPEMLADLYAYQLGERKAWAAVQNMRLFNSDQALEAGLVDESVEVEEVLPRSILYLKSKLKLNPKIFAETKKFFRKQIRDIVLNRDISAIAKETVDFNNDPAIKEIVMSFLRSLKRN